MLTIKVYGLPQPGGSKRAFTYRQKGTGKIRAAVTDDNPKSKSWQGIVATAAVEALKMSEWTFPLTGPLRVYFTFYMPRLKGHYKGKSNIIRADAPLWHTVKPDTLKLMRSTEDALTGIIWRDDAQCMCGGEKRYTSDNDHIGVVINIQTLEESHAAS